MHGFVDLAAHVHESGRTVENFVESGSFAHAKVGGAGKRLAGKGTGIFSGVNATHDRKVVGAEAVDGIGMEIDIGIDPERFLEACGKGIGSHLVAAEVNVRVSADSLHAIAPPLKSMERHFALRCDVGCEGDEDDATSRIHRRLIEYPRFSSFKQRCFVYLLRVLTSTFSGSSKPL